MGSRCDLGVGKVAGEGSEGLCHHRRSQLVTELAEKPGLRLGWGRWPSPGPSAPLCPGCCSPLAFSPLAGAGRESPAPSPPGSGLAELSRGRRAAAQVWM